MLSFGSGDVPFDPLPHPLPADLIFCAMYSHDAIACSRER